MKNLLLLIVSFLLSTSAFSQTYKNLVFEGGGIRGISYAGALAAMEEKGLLQHIRQTAGTSSGSIAALLVSLNYTSAEIDSIMKGLNFQKFNKGGGFFIGGISRLRRSYGWYKGEALEEWLGSLIELKTGNALLNFYDLHKLTQTNPAFKDLYVTGTNVTHQRTEIFSFINTPQLSIKTAVRISCSIPLYFQPVLMDSIGNIVKEKQKGINYSVYVDGGVMMNYPIAVFDSCAEKNGDACIRPFYNFETIGLKIERPEQIEQQKTSNEPAPYNTSDFNHYLQAFLSLMIESANRYDEAAEKGRTIYISSGNISPRVRKMSKDQKQQLFDFGKTAVQEFAGKN
jgi:NTE family protein